MYSTSLTTALGVLILVPAPVVVKYHLSVTVLDAVTTNPIVGATVFANGPEPSSGTTGPGGRVDFNEIQAGSYTVTASMTGYTSASVPLSLTSDTEITIRLQPTTPVPVGGISYLISARADDFGLWSLYLGLVSILMFATVATAICTKRVKRRKKKQ
jgi:hypothetical protein